MHANFSPSKDDENVDRVCIKRMLPYVRVFQKKRRSNDYIRVHEALNAAARMNHIRLPLEEVMMDSEIAAKIAYELV